MARLAKRLISVSISVAIPASSSRRPRVKCSTSVLATSNPMIVVLTYVVEQAAPKISAASCRPASSLTSIANILAVIYSAFTIR